ncbi:hypothetical protein [Microbulbifer sp. VAAF005]|uniref:hypothetical protein n=1 Tax=Microbulbifer sp. VAAF005 TaxID=3034230 RepID=UPI0024AE330A|nr:hypothetical protein [Microbulbifer sp. VAAF005]WHI46098.1 hypothetical protein P0078_20630 [Microbulbifer sp. VAAF005]
MKLIISKFEIVAGFILILVSVLAHIHSYTCFLFTDGCGVAEGLYALYGIVFGSSLTAAGIMLLHFSKWPAWLGQLLLVYVAIFSVTA